MFGVLSMLSFFMRTFALSFSIFWRALPCWAFLFAILYALFSFLSSSPLIFLFLLMFAFGTLSVFMIFVHIRSGLIVADTVNATDLGKLFKRSFKFFRFFAMFNGILTGLSIVAFVFAARIGIFDLDAATNAITSGSDEELMAFQAEMMHPAAYAYFAVMQIFSQMAYSALAVPMAANAAACTPKGRDVEIFWGFGAHTIRMFLLNLVSGTIVVALVIAYVFLLLTMPVFDGSTLLQFEDIQDITLPTTVASYAMLAALVLFPIAGFVWMVSLWCAGATVCYIDHRDKKQSAKDFEMECIYEKPLSIDELRELRMSRMNGIPAE